MSDTRVDASANVRVDASSNARITRSGSILSDDTLELLDASVGVGHRDGSAQVVYVLRASPLSLVTRTTEDQYFASTTFRTDSTDTPANTPMLGSLIPPNVRVSILSGNSIGRRTSTTRGTIKVPNPRTRHFDRNEALTDGRGRYDGLRRDYSWQDRVAQMYLGPEDGQFATAFDPFFPCLIKDFDWSEDAILLVPGPALMDADKAVQMDFYGQGYVIGFATPSADGGANINPKTKSPGGGSTLTVFDDLSGVLKPLAYGRIFGAAAQEISSSNEIHQFHTGVEIQSAATVQSLDAVYEDALEMTRGKDYDEDLEACTFTLTAESTGLITCDVHGALAGPSGTYIDRPGAIIQAVLTDRVGLAVADIATETLGDYDVAFDYECGFYFGSDAISRDEFLERMLAPLGFSFLSRDGRFRVGYVRNPAEQTPDLLLYERDILSVTRRATLQPVWRVRIGYAPVETPISIDSVAGAVIEAERARQSNPYRWAEAIDEGVLQLHKATEMTIKTRFSQRADAESLADETLRLHGRQRDLLEVKLSNKWLRYDIGDIVRLQWPRYDIVDDGDLLMESGDRLLLETGDGLLKEEDPGGTNYMVVGYVDNPAASDFSVTLWG